MTVRLLVLVLSACCLLPSSLSRSIVSRRFCNVGQFLNIQLGTCINCTTTCPGNQIIRRTCSGVTDSVCGPFFEFRQQNEDAERDRAMERQRLHQLLKRRHEGTEWSLLTNDTEFEDSSLSATLPSSESDVEPGCCWTNAGSIGVMIAAVLLFVLVAGLAISLFRLRFVRVVSGGSGQSRTHYYVTFPRVSSTSLSSSVDKRVKHLELQLHRNSNRGGWSVGSASGPHPFGGNEYVNEKLRKVLISNSNTVV